MALQTSYGGIANPTWSGPLLRVDMRCAWTAGLVNQQLKFHQFHVYDTAHGTPALQTLSDPPVRSSPRQRHITAEVVKPPSELPLFTITSTPITFHPNTPSNLTIPYVVQLSPLIQNAKLQRSRRGVCKLLLQPFRLRPLETQHRLCTYQCLPRSISPVTFHVYSLL